jgi:hypothetical protein
MKFTNESFPCYTYKKFSFVLKTLLKDSNFKVHIVEKPQIDILNKLVCLERKRAPKYVLVNIQKILN